MIWSTIVALTDGWHQRLFVPIYALSRVLHGNAFVFPFRCLFSCYCPIPQMQLPFLSHSLECHSQSCPVPASYFYVSTFFNTNEVIVFMQFLWLVWYYGVQYTIHCSSTVSLVSSQRLSSTVRPAMEKPCSKDVQAAGIRKICTTVKCKEVMLSHLWYYPTYCSRSLCYSVLNPVLVNAPVVIPWYITIPAPVQNSSSVVVMMLLVPSMCWSILSDLAFPVAAAWAGNSLPVPENVPHNC